MFPQCMLVLLLVCSLLLPVEVVGVTAEEVYASSKYHWSFNALYISGTDVLIPEEQGRWNGTVATPANAFLVEGVVNNSLSFEGTALAYLAAVPFTCLGDPTLCTTGLTAALWVHISELQTDPCVVLTSGADTSVGRGFYLKYLGSTSGFLKFYVQDDSKYWTVDVDYLPQQATNYWNHVGMVWNTTSTSATLTVFLNGEEVASMSTSVAKLRDLNVDNTVTLNSNTFNTETCYAKYDELALWENGLDYTEMNILYLQGIPSTTPSATGYSTTELTTEVVNAAASPGTPDINVLTLNDIYDELSRNSVSGSGAKILAENLANLTSTNDNLTTQELSLTLDILNEIAGLNSYLDSVPTVGEKTAIRNSFIETIDVLVDASNSDIWDRSFSTNYDVSTYLMRIVDSYANTLLSDGDFETFAVDHNNIEMKALATSDESDIFIEMGHGDVTIRIPASAFSPETSERRVVATVIAEMPRLANARQEKTANYSGKVVNSDVIAIDISQRASDVFQDDVIFVFKSKNITLSHPECVFLDKTGDWSTTGCDVVPDFVGTNTRCKCNHLTNFAVLMSLNPIEMSQTHVIALQITTYIGCSVSLVCLFLGLVLLLFLRELSSSRITILKNLIVALLLAEVLFMTGIQATKHKTICSVIAVFLHYLYLAVFSWMLVQGIQLLIKIRKVFDSNIRVLHFCVLGWGLPAVIVSVTLAIDYHGYGTVSHCWLSTVRHTIWAFIGPALVVIFVNTIVLIMVIRVFMSVKSNKDKTEIQKIRSGFRATALLLPLLGLTWAFGLLAIDETTIAFQYIFAILNSLQGLFIFICHCVMNDEVKSALNTRHKRLISQTDGESGFFTRFVRSGRSSVSPDDTSAVTRTTRVTATTNAM